MLALVPLLCVSAFVWSGAGAGAACDGELLFNGICLSRATPWPPTQLPPCETATPVPPYLQAQPPVINITIGRQLFVDPFLISQADGLTTVYHKPRYDDLRNPALASDRPWELWNYGIQSGEGYCGVATPFAGGVWWDALATEYKLYYRCGQTMCLATSSDALSWVKPELDVVNGTNIVIRHGDVGRATVWLDSDSKPDEPDSGRWKMTLLGAPGDGKSLSLLTSNDGVHFEMRGRTGPTMDGGSFFYNPFRRKWGFQLRQDSHMCGLGNSFQSTLTRTARYAEVPRGSFLGVPACVEQGVVCATNWTGCDTRSLCNNSAFSNGNAEHTKAVNWIWSDAQDPIALSPDHRSQLYSLEVVAYGA